MTKPMTRPTGRLLLDETDRPVQTCPECDVPQDEWPDPEGYSKDGQTYCCEGCAEGIGRTCQ